MLYAELEQSWRGLPEPYKTAARIISTISTRANLQIVERMRGVFLTYEPSALVQALSQFYERAMDPGDRKARGAFYTQLDYCRSAVRHLRKRAKHHKIYDPFCGSGAWLVAHVLEGDFNLFSAIDPPIFGTDIDLDAVILARLNVALVLPKGNRPQAKVRERALPKFYWSDPGMARGAAGLLNDPVDSTWLGVALETLIFHELRVFSHTEQKERTINYYRTGADVEIDFVIEVEKRTTTKKPAVVCLEIKSAKKWDKKWNRSLSSLKDSGKVRVIGMYGVYLGDSKYDFDGIHVLPVEEFLQRLFQRKIF